MEMERLWQQVRPLYEQLHAYVRRRLKTVYRAHAKDFPASKHIPAHLLGKVRSFDIWNCTRFIPYEDLRPTAKLNDKVSAAVMMDMYE